MKLKKQFKNLDLQLLGEVAPFGVALLLRIVMPQHLFTSIIHTIVGIFYLSKFAKQSVLNLKYKIIGIDLLVAIAAVGALLIGEPWESASVTFLFVFGKTIESKALFQSNEHVRNLIATLPSSVRMEDGSMKDLDEVSLGDRVKVLQGEVIPVDGVVLEGNAWVNEASITGESLPIEKEKEDSLYMGSLLEEGYVLVEVKALGESTIYGGILELVEDAQNSKGQTQRMIDRFAQYYTPSIIVLAMLSGIITQDIHIALSLLVVSCPGALVIAIPIASAVALNKATQNHILVKGLDVLEKITEVDTIAFDKTGTLSQNQVAVTKVIPDTQSEQEVLKIAANMEFYSEHPIAKAILKAYPLTESQYDSIDFHPGKGLETRDKGEAIFAGNKRLFDFKVPEVSQTAVYVGNKDHLYGTILCEDTVRPEAEKVITELKDYELLMLTGDNQKAAETIANPLGIQQVYAHLLPDDKLAMIQKYPKLMMVGDGMNDALALMKSYVGVSMGGVENGVALEAADIILVDKDLNHIPWLMKLATKVKRVMFQNISIAAISVIGLLIGVLDSRIHLSMGMLIHEVSVILVIVNALRLRR